MSKKGPTKKKLSFIAPKHETLEIDGDLSYGEGQRAWSVLRLKKSLIKEFPQLKNRREKFGYKLTLHRNWKELKEKIKEMEKNGDHIPIFMMFGRKSSE